MPVNAPLEREVFPERISPFTCNVFPIVLMATDCRRKQLTRPLFPRTDSAAMQLTDLFDLSLIARASESALDVDADGGVTTLTFGEIDARADRMARALAGRGVVAGDRVAVYLANRLEFIDLFLASVRLGIVLPRSTCSIGSARSPTSSRTPRRG